MGNAKRMWTHKKIKEEIYNVMDVLKLKRMPSASEIKRATGNTALVDAISRNGGFYKIAKDLGLEVKDSETKLGVKGEYFIKEKLEEKGFKVEKMSVKHPYDLLVNKNIKIDVKTAKEYKSPHGFTFHTFNLEKKEPTCDLYILVCIDDERIYILPSKFARQTQISLGENTKYKKYLDKWEYINKYDEFYKAL